MVFQMLAGGAYPLKYGVIAGKTNAFGDYYPHGSAVNNQRANAQSESVQAQCKSYIKIKINGLKKFVIISSRTNLV